MAKLDLGKLPRHHFKPPTRHVGCGKGHHADCLCDVNVTTKVGDKEAPIFGELADAAVGGVSEETVHEWASVLIGCHEKHLKLEKERLQMEAGLNAWARLPEFNRRQLVKCYRTRVAWREAQVWVPSNFSREDFKAIAKTYNVRLFTPSLKEKTK